MLTLDRATQEEASRGTGFTPHSLMEQDPMGVDGSCQPALPRGFPFLVH